MKKSMMIMVLGLLFLLCSCAHSPRPWTKGEKVAAGFFVLAHIADAYTTERYLDNPNNWEGINPLLGKHPSDTKLMIYFPLTGITAIIIGHYWANARNSLFLSYGFLNSRLTIHNLELY